MCSDAPSTAATSGCDVAGHGEIDQDTAAGRHVCGRDQGLRRSRRGNDDVGGGDRRPQVGEVDGAAAEPRRQRSGPVGVAVGDRDRARRRGRTGLRRRARPPCRRPRRARVRPPVRHPGARRASSAATEAGEAPPSSDRRLVAHALPGLERLVEEPVGDGAGRVPLVRRLVCLADLREDLGLARHHRVETARDAEQVARRRARRGGRRASARAARRRGPTDRPRPSTAASRIASASAPTM